MSADLLNQLTSPILFAGDHRIAYRDPAAHYHDGIFRLFYTLVETETDGHIYMYTAQSESSDLLTWSEPRRLTPRDRSLNFSSPGNIIRFEDRWVLCLQTYPRPNGEQYGTADARIWTMESIDLTNWSEPQLLRLKGDDVPVKEMGRMIDPYLIESVEEPGLWWCFYKQNGVSLSYSRDMQHWTYYGHEQAGENVCIIRDQERYVMFHSPDNGIGVMTSRDLKQWNPEPLLFTLGQQDWPWAQGRISAGFVLDGRQVPGVDSYLMFFHGSGPEDERSMFDTHASIGIAWSDDLVQWRWPKK